MAVFKNICIVDDDDLFLILTNSIMEDEDFAEEIHDFEDGRKALDYLKSVDDNNLPEVLLLDINMPMMDGWEFMEGLKELGIEDKMLIYITSSSINPLDLEKVESNPYIKALLSKPLDPEKLEKIASDRL